MDQMLLYRNFLANEVQARHQRKISTHHCVSTCVNRNQILLKIHDTLVLEGVNKEVDASNHRSFYNGGHNGLKCTLKE